MEIVITTSTAEIVVVPLGTSAVLRPERVTELHMTDLHTERTISHLLTREECDALIDDLSDDGLRSSQQAGEPHPKVVVTNLPYSSYHPEAKCGISVVGKGGHRDLVNGLLTPSLRKQLMLALSLEM